MEKKLTQSNIVRDNNSVEPLYAIRILREIINKTDNENVISVCKFAINSIYYKHFCRWHKFNIDDIKTYPKSNKRYLVVHKTGNNIFYRIESFSNDLSNVDEYDFGYEKYKNKKGFYNYESDYGYFETTETVIGWKEIELFI